MKEICVSRNATARILGFGAVQPGTIEPRHEFARRLAASGQVVSTALRATVPPDPKLACQPLLLTASSIRFSVLNFNRQAAREDTMSESKIEWTEQTWNPVTGCTKISPGCKNCYAETLAYRLQAMKAAGYERGFALTLHQERLQQPLQRKKPTVYFVNSMSDLFHEDVPDTFIEQVMTVAQRTPQHTYQILTKRAERLSRFFDQRSIPTNIWLGVSVEDRQYGLPRVDHLRRIMVRVRFLSIEPLLENLGILNLDGIHWVIVGGESGSKARLMKVEWVENIRQQCEQQNVQFFFKQWGGWGSDGKRRSKKANGRLLAGRTWDAMPELITNI
jgi:protein gp37